MDEKRLKRKSKYKTGSEHKSKRHRKYSSSDLSSESESSETSADSTSDELKKVKPDKKSDSFVSGSSKHEKRGSKKKKKEKRKHKREKLKKKSKKKSKKHKKMDAKGELEDGSKTKTISIGEGSAAFESSIGPKHSTKEETKPKRTMAPMTREEYEKQQSVIKRVLDPETGRYRLIKGDGEVIEEIVSKSRHKEINKQATRGDGSTFQRMLGLN